MNINHTLHFNNSPLILRNNYLTIPSSTEGFYFHIFLYICIMFHTLIVSLLSIIISGMVVYYLFYDDNN